MPALIDRATWAHVQAQLTANRDLVPKGATRRYLLRGLIRCGCGLHYAGVPVFRRGEKVPYYRCNRARRTPLRAGDDRCAGRSIPAATFEATIWDDCRAWVHDPGDAVADAQRAMREQVVRADGAEAIRAELERRLAA